MGTWTYSTEYYCDIPGVYFVKELKVTRTCSTEYYCNIPGVYFVKEPKVTWTYSTEYYCNIPGVFFVKEPKVTWTCSTEYYCNIPGVYFVKEAKENWTYSTEYYCNIPGVTLLESLRWPEHTVQNIIVIFRESTLLKSQWDLNIQSRRCCIVTRVCDVKEPKENWTHCTEYYCNIPRVCFVK